MIIKGRPKPRILTKFEAVIPRLRPSFPRLEKIKTAAAESKKGYIGEKKIDYHTDLLATRFTILYDVCLEIQGKRFQIDTIIITERAIFMPEIKNFNGTITFDTILNQFTRDDRNKETGYRYPITQAELHKFKLELWLQQHNLRNIPIYFFIAISEPSTIIKVIGDQEEIAKVVAHGEYIPKKILDMNAALASSGEKLNQKKIGHLILSECKEYDRDIMAQFDIKQSDLLPGVQCPGCGRLGMERIHDAWKCQKCQKKYHNAHKRALEDYLLLIKPWITNSECMYWLNFKSKNIATKLLREMGLQYNKQHRRWTSK
ncbi:nuclease-related domain-containing protein [Virgibacillus sp. C22-A2]|uniref:Nuclease-related domain-containing protein n=1 Tax=Virgibacillus tibetensis TaxID=3042313 RepID=A0ABU6KDK2_9BACI|nr:nuclease-related domain-containing protein [Virgibacillus sp. C22-A2]